MSTLFIIIHESEWDIFKDGLTVGRVPRLSRDGNLLWNLPRISFIASTWAWTRRTD